MNSINNITVESICDFLIVYYIMSLLQNRSEPNAIPCENGILWHFKQ